MTINLEGYRHRLLMSKSEDSPAARYDRQILSDVRKALDKLEELYEDISRFVQPLDAPEDT